MRYSSQWCGSEATRSIGGKKQVSATGGEPFDAGQTDIDRNKARTLWRQVGIELLEIQAFVGALNLWGGSEDQQGLVNARGTGNAHVGQNYNQI